MADISVKFGTPEPIKFREYDKNHPEIDLDLEVTAAGISVVTAYDGDLYSGDEEAAIKTGEIALLSLTDCVRAWPEGVSFWNNTTQNVLEKNINERLFEHGITARTDLFSLALTSESRELYDAAVKKVTGQPRATLPSLTIGVASGPEPVGNGPVLSGACVVPPPSPPQPASSRSIPAESARAVNTAIIFFMRRDPFITQLTDQLSALRLRALRRRAGML